MTHLENEPWERFAQENAAFYIFTTGETEWTEPGARAAFYETGEAEARHILAGVDELLPRRETALEIGCGVGRLTLPMARAFDTVVGVDISPTMLRLLSEEAGRRGVANVRAREARDDWSPDASVDFVYSWRVLQHIASDDVIADYAERVRRCLRPGGIAYLQFDARPRTLAYRVRNAVPDRLLPRIWRRGIRRTRRSRADLKRMFERPDLEVVGELGGAPEDHVLLLAKR
jgi:cyclopropane fatty-acyl-phospholipid synthase-like methyltransferase